MKTRVGFVSNSSSCSFVVLTTKDALKTTLDRLEKKEKEFIKSFLSSATRDKCKLHNVDTQVYLGTYYSENECEKYEEIFSEEPEIETVEGCDHEFDRKKIKFCPECGEERFIKQEVEKGEYIDPEEAAEDLIKSFFKLVNEDKNSYAYFEGY